MYSQSNKTVLRLKLKQKKNQKQSKLSKGGQKYGKKLESWRSSRGN